MFDALIGNVDRHADNWGFIATTTHGDQYSTEMAPLFDNGTSLEYGKLDDALKRISEDLDSYIKRGRHHCSWNKADMKGTSHLEMCGLFGSVYEPTVTAKNFMMPLNNYAIDSVMDWCVGFQSQVPFTDQRADFLGKLLRRRRDLLTLIGDHDD